MPKYTKRKDGRYQTKIYLGLDESNKKKYKYLYASSEKELRHLESELLSKLNKGIDIVTADDTHQQWLDRLKAVKETELTDSEYETFVARASYFSSKFGNTPLNEIGQQAVQPVINEVFKCNPTTHKPSARRTVERYLSTASAVFEYAIENRAVDFNPCRYVKIPKAAKTSERRALTLEERKWVEEMPHRAQLPAMLMMYSGLRKGEVTALLWSDIDFNNHTITVSKSYDFKQGRIKEPKTASGVRVVTVPGKLIDYLKTQPKKGIYVVTTKSGRMMTLNAWKSLWESYMLELSFRYGKTTEKRERHDPRGQIMSIEPFTMHSLRHTFCTIMYEAGIDVLTAKEQMGHSDVKTTLSIYTHLDKKYKKKNVDKMNVYLASGE